MASVGNDGTDGKSGVTGVQGFRHGTWGRLFRYGAVGSGLLLPSALRFAAWVSGPRLERALSTTGAICTLAGTLAERFAIVEAGKVSADDPLAYQELTRGAPGEARPTPARQARHVPQTPAFTEHVVAPEVTA